MKEKNIYIYILFIQRHITQQLKKKSTAATQNNMHASHRSSYEQKKPSQKKHIL